MCKVPNTSGSEEFLLGILHGFFNCYTLNSDLVGKVPTTTGNLDFLLGILHKLYTKFRLGVQSSDYNWKFVHQIGNLQVPFVQRAGTIIQKANGFVEYKNSLESSLK